MSTRSPSPAAQPAAQSPVGLGPLDEALVVDTAEQVSLALPVAGLTSRMMALLIDCLILGLALGLAAAAQYVTSGGLPLGRPDPLLTIISSAIGGLYFLVCEYFMHGQTPGKRVMRLRVVDRQGQYPNGAQILLRNLIRPADFLLSILGIEFFVLFWTPESLRIGDLVAGTVVIRETTIRLEDIEPQLARQEFIHRQTTSHAGVQRSFRQEDRQLLRRYLERSGTLPEARRRELAGKLLEQLAVRHPMLQSSQGLAPEDRLIALWRALESEAKT